MVLVSETILSVCLGLGLSAATGFRIFVPLLLINLANRADWLELGESFKWMGGTTALMIFAVATVVEIAAYYIPWLDNLLDSIASPAAVVAGTLVTASVVVGMDPIVKWVFATIAGGGAAGLTQTAFVGARQLSVLSTGGLGNPLVATIELIGSFVLSVLSFLMPILTAFGVIVLLLLGTRRILRRRSRCAEVT